MKGEDDGWLLIHEVNKNYSPLIDLNLEELKQQETQTKFGIRRKK